MALYAQTRHLRIVVGVSQGEGRGKGKNMKKIFVDVVDHVEFWFLSIATTVGPIGLLVAHFCDRGWAP